MYPQTDSTGSRKNSPEAYRGVSSYESDPAARTMRSRFDTIWRGVLNMEMSPELRAYMANLAATPSEADASRDIETNARATTAAQAPSTAAPAEVKPADAQKDTLDIDTIRATIDRTAEPIGSRGSGGVAEKLPAEVVNSINLPTAAPQYAGDNDGRLALGA